MQQFDNAPWDDEIMGMGFSFLQDADVPSQVSLQNRGQDQLATSLAPAQGPNETPGSGRNHLSFAVTEALTGASLFAIESVQGGFFTMPEVQPASVQPADAFALAVSAAPPRMDVHQPLPQVAKWLQNLPFRQLERHLKTKGEYIH